ncbi:MAG: Flp pilus assembly complex ATPase component, partial [Oligoflexia bacterium]|nr:Flp pilus assembly complex ATPase component [Oligoflexia bacterium]
MSRVDSFLHVAVDQRGSDLHLHAGKPPAVRIDGELIALPFRSLGELESRRLLHEILEPQQRASLEAHRQLDFVHIVDGLGRFRGNAFYQRQGLSAVFRIVPDRIATLEELLMPVAVRELSRRTNGLVLVTGPTGSGKSTTLAAMIQEINRNSARHIITLEDPVEFIHHRVKSAITQREVGGDVDSFATGLRSALRESPDVLMVGELRDPLTVQLALQAAETGILVLGTLHTRSAAMRPSPHARRHSRCEMTPRNST